MRSDSLIWNCQEKVDAIYSRLFHVPARDFGQPATECFTSHIIRTANTHLVSPHTLISNEVLPLLAKPYLYKSGVPIHDALGKSWWSRTSVTLNSLNSTTEQWVQVFAQLTQNTQLRFSTLLPYRGVLPNRGLIKSSFAWCPVCYQECLASGEVIYDPLLWAIKAVTVCTKHHRRLQLVCPFSDCGSTVTAISSKAQIGFCPYCNRWLGTEKSMEETTLSSREWEWQEYVVEAVGELLAAAPTLKIKPSKENIAVATRQYIDEILSGNAKALADQLGMNHKSVYEIRDGTQLPQLNTLLKLCKLFGIHPLGLLTSVQPTIHQETFPTDVQTVTRARKTYRRFDSEKVRTALETYLAADSQPLSMASIARALGYDPTFINAHFPHLCSAISERFEKYRSSRKELRISRECDEISQVILKLHLQGIYPSYRRIREKARGGLLREKRVREAYMDTMKQLGYRK